MRSYNSDKLKLIIALLIYGTIGVVRKNIPYPSRFIAFARAAIGFLKDERAGRATFLPLDTVQPGVFRGRLSGTARPKTAGTAPPAAG